MAARKRASTSSASTVKLAKQGAFFVGEGVNVTVRGKRALVVVGGNNPKVEDALIVLALD